MLNRERTDNKKVSSRVRRLLVLPWIVGGTAFLVTLGVTVYYNWAMTSQDELRFETARLEALEDVSMGMEKVVALLRGGAGLFASSREVGRDEFSAFERRIGLRKRYPGIQGIGFAKLVTPDELDTVTLAAQAEDIPEFHIWPDVPREKYFPILFLEPRDTRNRAALGFDMYSDPVRREAMDRARDGGDAAATGKVRLVQELDPEMHQSGFLVYLPVYWGGAVPPTIEERRRKLEGFIYSPLRADDFFEAAFLSGARTLVGLRVYDGSRPERDALIHVSDSLTSAAASGWRPAYRTLDRAVVAGRPWLIEVASLPGFEHLSNRRFVPFLAGAGMLVSVLLFMVTRWQVRARVNQTLAEEATLAERERLLVTLASIADAVVVTDVRGRVTFLNRVAERILGWTMEEALGRPVTEVFPVTDEETGKAAESLAIRILTSGTPGPLSSRSILTSRSGEHIPIEDSAAPIQIRGELIGVVKVFRDVSERRRHEYMVHEFTRDLAAARDEAVEANQAKSAFLANMSHELRTPLNAIIGYAELLEEDADAPDPDPGAAIEDLRKIRQAGHHLLTLINDILDLSKIEAGKMDLSIRSFDICALVGQVVGMVEPLMSRHDNQLTVSCPAQVGTMRADETRLRQVLFNLLSNASKFTEHGKVSLEVERESGEEGDWILFRVSDTGIGMSPEEQRLLFRDFMQVDSSFTRRHGGTGLGLAISRRFSEMMGGQISVTSEKGKGSVFTVRLPAVVVKPSSSPPETHAPAAPNTLPADAPRTETNGSPARSNLILVVDDDPAVHDLMRRTLEREGFQVASAYDGRSAVDMARDLHPRAITLDVMMPDLDGWMILGMLKADPQLRDIPVIIVTIVEDRNLGYALGAADYLTKPVERDRLLTALRRHICPPEGNRILIVDDDSGARQLLGRALRGAGYEILEAGNGREALDTAWTAPPSLILLDLTMPEMDGFKFLEQKRYSEMLRSVPVIVMSARELSEQERHDLHSHVQRVLQKGSYGREDLLREICTTLLQLT